MKKTKIARIKLMLLVLIIINLLDGFFASLANAQTSIKPEENAPIKILTDSALGIHGLYEELKTNDFANVTAAGVQWIRVDGIYAMAWDFVEPIKTDPPTYSWNTSDAIVTALHDAGYKIIWTTKCFNRWDQGVSKPNGKAPKNMKAYKDFIRAAAERYDGDGIDDAPGSPIVLYWQIENEVDFVFWNDTAANYALVLKEAYTQIKSANNYAKVAMAGASSPIGYYDFYREILNELDKFPGGKFFDIMDIHWFKNAGDYKAYPNPTGDITLASFIQEIKTELANRGYLLFNIWFTETGTYSGSNVIDQNGNPLPAQDEQMHARELFKRYIHFIGNGVKKVFWQSMLESGSTINPNNYFNNVGLINNSLNDGQSFRKLAYYTYKIMSEKLTGSDWDLTEKIREDGTVYIYKFFKGRNEILVAWNDSESNQQISLELTNISSINITEAVPNALSGNKVDENAYLDSFITTNMPVINGKVSFTLAKNPVFIEMIICYGDLDNSGLPITAYDAALTARGAVGLDTLTPAQATAADVDGSTNVDAFDAALIARKAVGLLDKFPVEG